MRSWEEDDCDRAYDSYVDDLLTLPTDHLFGYLKLSENNLLTTRSDGSRVNKETMTDPIQKMLNAVLQEEIAGMTATNKNLPPASEAARFNHGYIAACKFVQAWLRVVAPQNQNDNL